MWYGIRGRVITQFEKSVVWRREGKVVGEIYIS
jgi:hypothetical protein